MSSRRIPPAPPRPSSTKSSAPPLEVVDPRWLVKAGAVAILAALLCAYLTLCLLFYQGQWQLVLHPTRASIPPPADAQFLRFGAAETGTPQLTGWWLSAPLDGRYAATTLLFLPAANGSLAASAPDLLVLNHLGINVFAFDYRGYGQSADIHPTQLHMGQDAAAAFDYLTTARGIQPQSILPYGIGVGASLAAGLAASHPAIPAVILEAPDGDLLGQVQKDPRARLLPTSLLFHDRFPLADPLASLKTPKLLISYPSTSRSVSKAIHVAADPKTTVELSDDAHPVPGILIRFLDQYLPVRPALLSPSQVPSRAPVGKTLP